ncbi:MAG: AI-2E family transporter [Chitinophagaceae bacterium]|nr:AI-2E family transporter [Chitinophagaceae bacterium]
MEPKVDVRVYPFYIKATVVLLGLFLFIQALSVLADVLIPLAIATLVAILLNPLHNWLQRRMPRVVAIVVSILIAIIIVAGVLYFLSTQIAMFSKNLPVLKQKFSELITELHAWVENTFGISADKQKEMTKSAASGSQQLIRNTLGTILGTLGVIILIPIYVFLLLFYKPLILNFLYQVFLEKHSLRVAEILSQTKRAVQSYMVGLLMETAIVCTLNSIALLIIGVPYAIVIGVIGGILNLLPYLGGLVAIALPVLMATITSHGFSMQLQVIVAYLIIQFIDNNILVPRIVSSQVQINALISIVFVLLGGMLWGLPGMFLAIPFIAVLKIIFDRVDELKPWGSLLGDEVPTEHIGVQWQKRWGRIFRRIQKEKIKEKIEQAEADT